MIDLRLYALLDPERAGGRDLAALGRAVVAGGATLVQLRDKHGSTRRLIDETRAIKAALSASRVPVLVNDRVDVALAAGADGVHVGQDDMPAAEARRLLGPDAVIGLSVKTIAQAEAAPLELLDYVCVGGVFATTSKETTAAPIGVAGLKTVLAVLRARDPRFPAGAIAGIDETNASAVVAAGADGVAVISALSLASDPQGAARRLRDIVEQSLHARADP
jgi:thiamine-phosphate pyrophosphorylase